MTLGVGVIQLHSVKVVKSARPLTGRIFSYGTLKTMLLKLFYLGLAGAAGTLARYGLSGLVGRSIGTTFPWGTAVVNILGCLFFGLLWAFFENRLVLSGQLRMILFVGFFGAFTTFSTFAFETSQLLDDSQWLWAAGNFLLQTMVGLIAVMAGLAIGKLL